MRRLWYVMWKELLELRSDPRLFGVIFIAPVVQFSDRSLEAMRGRSSKAAT